MAPTTPAARLEAIVSIAKGMGKETVAGFVSDQEMMDQLKTSGVDYAQGFHIGAPQPIAQTFARSMGA